MSRRSEEHLDLNKTGGAGLAVLWSKVSRPSQDTAADWNAGIFMNISHYILTSLSSHQISLRPPPGRLLLLFKCLSESNVSGVLSSVLCSDRTVLCSDLGPIVPVSCMDIKRAGMFDSH